MHVLDANDLFGVTSYTYDMIMEKGGKRGPDAFALYFKLMKQARMQQTNQTFTLNKFLMNYFGWGDDRVSRAKKVLKDLGLIDDVTIRDKGKIIGHFVRVNYLIDEDKLRDAGHTYNLTTTTENQGVEFTTTGGLETNALSTKHINALSTQEENILSKDNISEAETIDETQTFLNSLPVAVEKKEKSSAKKERKDITELILTLKATCAVENVVYDNEDERMFAKHILDAEHFGKISEGLNMTRQEFAVAILKESIRINYWKGYCTGPKRIYNSYVEIVNKFIANRNKQYSAVLDDL